MAGIIQQSGSAQIAFVKQREIRKAKINTLINKEVEESKKINTLPLEEQKKLNTSYNDILTQIHSIRDKHPLQNIVKGLEGIDDGIDSDLHDVGTRAKALRETYRDEKGIVSNRVAWEDGTVMTDKKVSPNHRSRIVRWKDGIINSRENFPQNKPFTSETPTWIEKDSKEISDTMEKAIRPSLTSPDLTTARKPSKIPVNMSDFEKKLDKTLSESPVADESRTVWPEKGIKQKEILYGNGLKESTTNWEKEGIKRREIFNQADDFYFSHTVKDSSLESYQLRQGDMYLEKNVNYDKGSSLWKYERPDKKLEHGFIRGEDGAGLSYTTMEDSSGRKYNSLITEDNIRSYNLTDNIQNKQAKMDLFPEGDFQANLSTPERGEKTIIHKNGVGTDRKINSAGEETNLSWFPDRKTMRYSKKYADGTENKCYFYGNKLTRQSLSYPDGNSYELLELPNNVIKKAYNYKNGTKESLTWFGDGEQRRTVSHKDGSFLTDMLYHGQIQRQGIKFADGSAYLYKNWGNDITQQCYCWPDKGLAHMSTEFEKDGIFEHKYIYSSGAYRREVEKKETEDGKAEKISSLLITKDPAMKSLFEGPLREHVFSPVNMVKFLKDPFRNPILTMDSHLWASVLLMQNRFKEELIKSAEKIQAINSGKEGQESNPLYMKLSFNISSG